MVKIKQVKQKTCLICKELFTPFFNTAQRVCGFKCAEEYARRKGKKEIEKLQKLERKELREAKAKIKPRSKLVSEAQAEFNKFIRTRDLGGKCICCDKPLGVEAVGGAYDCGHYRSVGSAPHLRFDERNAHGQTKYCNRWLNGNVVGYRQGLINKIGLAEVERLEADQAPKKYSSDDLIDIAKFYKQKTKALQNGRVGNV